MTNGKLVSYSKLWRDLDAEADWVTVLLFAQQANLLTPPPNPRAGLFNSREVMPWLVT